METLTQYLSTETLYPLLLDAGMRVLRILFIFAVAFTLTKVLGRLIRRLRERIVMIMAGRAGGSHFELEKRAATISSILRKTVGIVIWTVALMMTISEVGVNVAPLLAGAGVAGLAVGFGAQNLVRDVISGLFILLENQIRVNDVAIINGTGGLVEEINLRTTVLRSLDGVVHVFPNGTITTLSNVTREFSCHVFDIGVAYKEDTDRVVELLKEVGEDLRQDETCGPEMIEPVEIFGVDRFADSAVVIKGKIKTRPSKQWMVGREFNRRVKKRFDEEGIEIPFPHRSLYFGEASKPFAMKLDEGSREEIKQAVREVLKEMKAEPSS
jgi:small conductance mechanosensitive channel